MGRRELTGGTATSPATVKGRRVKSTVSKPKAAKGPNLTVRTRTEAKRQQRGRRNVLLGYVRGTKPNARVRKEQTGMSQLSLIGAAKPLVRFRPVKPKRR